VELVREDPDAVGFLDRVEVFPLQVLDQAQEQPIGFLMAARAEEAIEYEPPQDGLR